MKNITVCTLAINDWYRNIVRYSIRNLENYCKLHDYKFVIQTEESSDTVYDGKRECPWYKIPLIKKILKETNTGDYIVWIDIDTQILKNEQPLEYFLDKYLKDDVVFALPQEINLANTGIIFMKNCQFNVDLMDRIYDNPNNFEPHFHEQASLNEIYERDEDVRKKIHRINNNLDELVVYWSRYFPNKSFAIHLARCSHDKMAFMYMMDSYCMSKLDEESEQQYKDRIEWLSDEKLCRPDIDGWMSGKYIQRRYSERCKMHCTSF